MSVASGRSGGDAFTLEAFRRRAQECLDQRVPASARELSQPSGRGDGDLNPAMTLKAVRHAAVLVPVIERGGEASVILTQRTDSLPSHAGQIAFPGGKVDEADAGPVAAALRETHEEIGLDAAYISIIGMLDSYQTGTGYRILPVVAAVSPGYTLRPEPGEVSEIFDVPLAFLMDPENHQTHSREWAGATRYYYAIPYQHRYIWGATAGILRNLYDRVYHR